MSIRIIGRIKIRARSANIRRRSKDMFSLWLRYNLIYLSWKQANIISYTISVIFRHSLQFQQQLKNHWSFSFNASHVNEEFIILAVLQKSGYISNTVRTITSISFKLFSAHHLSVRWITGAICGKCISAKLFYRLTDVIDAVFIFRGGIRW